MGFWHLGSAANASRRPHRPPPLLPSNTRCGLRTHLCENTNYSCTCAIPGAAAAATRWCARHPIMHIRRSACMVMGPSPRLSQRSPPARGRQRATFGVWPRALLAAVQVLATHGPLATDGGGLDRGGFTYKLGYVAMENDVRPRSMPCLRLPPAPLL